VAVEETSSGFFEREDITGAKLVIGEGVGSVVELGVPDCEGAKVDELDMEGVSLMSLDGMKD